MQIATKQIFLGISKNLSWLLLCCYCLHMVSYHILLNKEHLVVGQILLSNYSTKLN